MLQRQSARRLGHRAKTIDYRLNRWAALTCCLDDGDLPADNNGVGYPIRPMALGRKN